MSETTTTAWRSSISKVNNSNGAGGSNSNKRPRLPNSGRTSRTVLPGTAAAAAAAAAALSSVAFIPSPTWQGSRPGYYFGTTDRSKGTGYYRDDGGDAAAAPHEEEQQALEQPPPAAASRRRVVRIAEENNEVRTLPPTAAPLLSNAERLLQEAEAAAAAREGGGTSASSGATASAPFIKPMDLSSVRGVQQAALAMRKLYERNQLERAQHDGDPTAYMDSEVSLYEYLRAFMAVAADPALLYPAIVQQKVVEEQLVPLLQHDNFDIRMATISLLVEWLDVSLLLNDETGEIVPAVVALAAIVLSECSELLVANLACLQKTNSSTSDDDDDDLDDDEVGQGAADILTVIENLLEMDLTLSTITAAGSMMGSSISSSHSDDSALRLVPDGSSVALQLCRPEQQQNNNNNGQSTTTSSATTSTNHHLIAWLLAQAENNSKSSSLADRSLELLALLAPREDVHQLLPDWSRIPAYRSMFDDDDDDDSNDKKPTASNKGASEATTSNTIDGIEILLQRVAPFRKLQQLQDAEIEALENASMILAAALYYSPQNVDAFVDAQGIELVLRCIKARTHAGGVTLRWLDFIGSPPSLSLSVSSSSSGENYTSSAASSASVYRRACEHLIDAGALKYIFPLLMGRSLPKPAITATSKSAKLKKAKLEWNHNIEQTTIRILYALTRHLTEDNSPNHAKERLLAKFVENNAEKCKRIVDLCLIYDQKARAAEYKFYRSDLEETLQGLVTKEDNDDEEESPVQLAAALNAKLKGGGDLFHRLGAICAFCCTGSRTCHEHVLSHLHAKESGIGLIRDALQEFISILGDDEQKAQLSSYLEQL
jgi:beta-catenin-like protein 1